MRLLSCSPLRRGGGRRWPWRLLAAITLLVLGAAQAATLRFESAGTYLLDDVYYLDCYARIELGESAAQALVNGVELNFVLELAVHKTRRWWIDTPIHERRLRYRLFYYDLTQHYRVVEEHSGVNSNHSTLAEALHHMGTLSRYPLVPASKINKRRSYTASVSIELDRTRLPGPLMAKAMVSRAWQLQSEVFRWSLN